MIFRAPLRNCDAVVYRVGVAIIDQHLTAEDSQRAEEQARAVLAGDLDAAPDATIPKPRLRLVLGEHEPDRDAV